MTKSPHERTNGMPMTDGSLPSSLNRLNNAIYAVFKPLTTIINNQTHTAPSLYDQLCEAVAGQTGERSGGKAGMPLWVDAADLKNVIITQLAQWQVKGTTPHERITNLQKRPWRPQDCDYLETISAVMETWPHHIRALLSPEPKWSLAAACPNCNTTVVHRRDSAGDIVRQPALQISNHGCVCQRCRTLWEPKRFAHLARVLGYDTTAVAE